MACVDVHERERDFAGSKSLSGQMGHHDAIFSAREEQNGSFELGRDFPKDVHGLRFEFPEVIEMILAHGVRNKGARMLKGSLFYQFHQAGGICQLKKKENRVGSSMENESGNQAFSEHEKSHR